MIETTCHRPRLARPCSRAAPGCGRNSVRSSAVCRLVGFEVRHRKTSAASSRSGNQRCFIQSARYVAWRHPRHRHGCLDGAFAAAHRRRRRDADDDRSVPGAGQGRTGALRSLISTPRALHLFTEVGSIPGRYPGRARNRNMETARREVTAPTLAVMTLAPLGRAASIVIGLNMKMRKGAEDMRWIGRHR